MTDVKMLEEKMVSSIDELLHALSDKKFSGAWYRGVKSSTYALLPTIFREGLEGDKERDICRRLDRRSSLLITRSPNDRINLLILMQHYGIPTRLLDWTLSLPIALSFALERFREGQPTIWVLNPQVFGRVIDHEYRVATSHDQIVSEYAEIAFRADCHANNRALTFEPYYPDHRMHVQQSRFTIHGMWGLPLEEQINQYSHALEQERLMTFPFRLMKIVLDFGSVDRSFLKRLRLDDSILYPDREGLIGRIARELRSDAKLQATRKGS